MNVVTAAILEVCCSPAKKSGFVDAFGLVAISSPKSFGQPPQPTIGTVAQAQVPGGAREGGAPGVCNQSRVTLHVFGGCGWRPKC